MTSSDPLLERTRGSLSRAGRTGLAIRSAVQVIPVPVNAARECLVRGGASISMLAEFGQPTDSI